MYISCYTRLPTLKHDLRSKKHQEVFCVNKKHVVYISMLFLVLFSNFGRQFVPVVIVKRAAFSLAKDATALDNPSKLLFYNKSSDSILPWHMLNENFRSNLLIVSDSLPYIGNKINCMSGYHSWILKGYGIKTNDKFRFSSITPIPKDTYKSFKFPRMKTACHSIE